MTQEPTTSKRAEPLPVGKGVLKIEIANVLPNPQNSEIYDTDVDDVFLSSIKSFGVLEPLVITPERVLLSGHRRLLAARTAGLDTVPVVVRDVPEPQYHETILEYNKQRNKTTIEHIREFRAYLDIERRAAEVRMQKSAVANLPQGATGKARDIAAKRAGLSGRSAENGLRVLQEIDRRRSEASEREAVETVTRALQKSINAGLRAAIKAGWLECPKPSQEPAEKTPLELDAEQPFWIGPSWWQGMVDSCDTEDEKARLSRAFEKLVAILRVDLGHPDPTTQFELQHLFVIVLSNCFKIHHEGEARNQQPEAGDSIEKAAK